METKLNVIDLEKEIKTILTPNLVRQYAEVKTEIKELTEKAKRIESVILSGMQEQEMKSFKSNHGTFSLVARKLWRYTEAVTKLELQLKTKRVEEEESGAAQFLESPSLRFTAPKNE